MRTDIICADYPQLERIVQRFQQTSERIQLLHQSVEKPLNRLKSGGWEGRGADSFYTEMDRRVIPAIVRLKKALSQAARTMARISHTVRTAEEEAAALFRKEAVSSVTVLKEVPSNFAKVNPISDTSTGTPPAQFVRYDLNGGNFQTDPQTEVLLESIYQFIENHGDPAILLTLFPDLGRLDDLSQAQLQALLDALTERQEFLDTLYASQMLHEMVAVYDLLPDNIEELTNAELWSLLESQQLERDRMALTLGFWILGANPELSAELMLEFSLLSPQEQIDFLYSLTIAMPNARDYLPGTPLSDTLPPILFLSETPPSPELEALFHRTVTKMRDMMSRSVEDGELASMMFTTSPMFGDEVAEGGIEGGWGGGSVAMAAAIPPTIRNIGQLGLSSDGLSNLWAVAVRIGNTGKQGLRRLGNFMRALPEAGLRRLAQTFDINFNLQIYNRLDYIRSLPEATLRMMGYTDLEIQYRNFIRHTDISVPELNGTPIMYGASRNTNGRSMAFEFNATGKPDPTLAIYAATSSGTAEFDWYRMQDGHLVLLDAKYAQPNGLYDLNSPFGSNNRYRMADEALRQSEAARLIGQNVTVEWVVPRGTSQEMVDAMQAYLEIDLQILNINVVRAAS